MSDLASCFVVLAAIYLSDCVFWLRRNSVVFFSLFRRHCRWIQANSLFGNDSGAIFLGNFLPPLGSVYVCEPWPISVSPWGIYSYVAASPNPGERLHQSAFYLPFEEIQSCTTVANELYLNGRVFIKVGSPRYARQLAGLIHRLRQQTIEERDQSIGAALTESTNVESIDRRVTDQRQQSQTLRFLCNSLFVYLFCVAPAVIGICGLTTTWAWLLLAFIIGLGLVVTQYAYVHWSLYPEALGERIFNLLLMILAPPGAIRAVDLISRDLLAGYHPVAVARVICPEEKFLAYARRVLRDARFPIAPTCPTNDERSQATEKWFRSQLNSVLINLVRQSAGSVEELFAAPKPEGEDCRSYCPRCERQFVLLEGECVDCDGIPLRVLELSRA